MLLKKEICLYFTNTVSYLETSGTSQSATTHTSSSTAAAQSMRGKTL